MQAVENRVLIVLLDYFLCFGLKLFSVFFCPPVAQAPVFIILPALIIKAMCHFVTDDCAKRTINERIASIIVKKRKLKDSGWENDLIERRVIISVDRWRRHKPLGCIYRFAQLSNAFSVFMPGRCF